MKQKAAWIRRCLPLLLIGLCIASFGAAWAHSAIEPLSRPEQEWWAKRHNAILERVQQGNVDLIMLGDSI
ncbi:MAG TPA: hypothetical protein ENN80_03395, partial [Candidatus Hydrogenedentes bacterium]|nr:hypothetical protein [Candidatus Hydrogenedentota bacterium]